MTTSCPSISLSLSFLFTYAQHTQGKKGGKADVERKERLVSATMKTHTNAEKEPMEEKKESHFNFALLPSFSLPLKKFFFYGKIRV